jgi:oligopeptide transport system ATP-binding protein
MTVTKSKELVKVDGLKKHFSIGNKWGSKNNQIVKAVDDLSFSIYEGETLGIVGESGCGKSTMGRLLLRLLEPTEGSIYYNGKNMTHFSKKELLANRRDFQMIFQDPYASLNPRMTVREIVKEPLKTYNENSTDKRVKELLDAVGIPAQYLDRYPHEFSGGQRQRIGISRSLALNPKFIVADEPVAALDVSIQAQILNLIQDLQTEFDFTFLFIAHDLSVVQYISDRVGVMYLGKMVELADSDTLYQNPVHPYTQALLSSIPVPDPTYKREGIRLTGEIPSPVNPPTGCRFHTRCPLAKDICKQIEPEWIKVEENHFTACHVVQERLS